MESDIKKLHDNYTVQSTKYENIEVKGYDFNKGVDYAKIMETYHSMGIQATNVALAVDEINHMIHWRLSDDPIKSDDLPEERDPLFRKNMKCTIFLGYTSNMISCGMREIIRYLCEHKMVDCMVTTCGGIEEDLIKCLASTYIGAFDLKGEDLRKAGLNRIGNMIIPNDNYCKFEDWIFPILEKMYQEQKKENKIWSPMTIINRLGKEINNESSVYYWCYKNDIPVFCPGLTDGSLGDMFYLFSFKQSGFIIDINQDIRSINDIARHAYKSGIIILGGGIIKHHICNANLARNGAEYSVFINTSTEFDASDTGAQPDEAISWGKIKMTAHPVKIYSEATLVFPLIVAQTFAKYPNEATRLLSK